MTHNRWLQQEMQSERIAGEQANQQRDLLRGEAGSGRASGVPREILALILWIVTLPWRAFRWIGIKVPPEERAARR